MICFEVWVNGEKVCLAGVGEGVGDTNVLAAHVTRVGKQGRQPMKPDLHVGGLVNKDHVRWTEKQKSAVMSTTFRQVGHFIVSSLPTK